MLSTERQVNSGVVERLLLKPSVGVQTVCGACGYRCDAQTSGELGSARGNSTRFCQTRYTLWKCPACQSIKTLGEVDFENIYKHYPLKKRELDLFARCSMAILLRRLTACGLKKKHAILDYGCGNGIFIQFLKSRGYQNVQGYDPYESTYSVPPLEHTFDCVVANDVIEHCAQPSTLMQDCLKALSSDGLELLYVGTAESDGVDMEHLEPHLMRLHLPYHRTIFSRGALHALGERLNLVKVRSWTRSYMDTFVPFCNYRFLDELNNVLGHRIDRAFESDAVRAVCTHPRLWFYGMFGRWFPSAMEPAVAWRLRPTAGTSVLESQSR